MLQKVPIVEVARDNIFINDKMKRKDTVELFTNLISTVHQPFTICLNAPWGGGKTTFIKMWEKYLEKNNYISLYFNAWENDFSNEPFVSIVSEISMQLSDIATQDEETIKTVVQELKEKGVNLFYKTLPLSVKLLTLNTLDSDDIKDMFEGREEKAIADFLSKVTEEQIQNYENSKSIREDFKNTLSSFAQTIIDNEGKNKPIVFFIDELDRCKPSYTIELLENIKHIFNIENFIFILSVDKQQLQSSIKATYGQGIDSETYLRKFFDIDLKLPFFADKDYLTHLIFDVFKFNELQIFKHDNTYELEHSINLFKYLIEIYRLSIRDIEQISSELNMIVRTMFNKQMDTSLTLLLFLTTIKSKDKDIFNALEEKTIDGTSLIETLENHKPLFKKFFDEDRYVLYCILLASNISENEYAQFKDQDFGNPRINEMLNYQSKQMGFGHGYYCYKRVERYLIKLNMIDRYI